jgi:alkane 1-monooxygenase
MDKRLLALPQIRGDLSRVNLDPKRRQALVARYGAAAAAGARQAA